MVLCASHRMIFSNTIARAEIHNPYALLHRVGDLVPNKLVESGVLMLGFEGSNVGGHLGSVLHTLAGCRTDLSEAGTVGDLGRGEGGFALGDTSGVAGISQHSRVRGSGLAYHIGGTVAACEFAADGVDGVDVSYFSHFEKMKNYEL